MKPVVKGKKNGEGALFAAQEFAAGDPVLPIMGTPRSARHSNNLALQVGPDLFVGGDPGLLDNNINHACIPNMRADIGRRQYVAIKPIKVADELTFNYNATDYDLEKTKAAFDCWCGSDRCYGRISGFKHLSPKQKQELLPLLPHWLRRLALESSWR